MLDTQLEKPTPTDAHLMDSVTEGVLVLENNGEITLANQEAEQLLGYAAGTLAGHHLRELWHELPPILNGVPFPTSKRHEAKLQQKNGRFISTILSITPAHGVLDNKQLISIRLTNDVHHLDDALTHTQRLASIGTLTASVAHELTNPISIITAVCNNLLYETKSSELDTKKLEKYTNMIEQSAWRCARIIDVLRNYTPSNEPEHAVTDLNTIIEDSLTLVQEQFRKKYHTTIQTALAPNLKSIVCAHNLITQVIVNLLTNARDAMQPTGGEITIVTQGRDASSSLIGVDSFQISIRDEGHGIPRDLTEQIYKPFFTTKPTGVGMGLGLYIARGIVEQHNGRIWATNNRDGGATFHVLLPAYPAQI